MSIAILTEIWADPPVGGSQLLVLLALADNADEERRLAWPSVSRLGRKTKLSDRSVQRSLRELEEQSVIEVVRPGGRVNGEYRATVYRVLKQGRQDDTPDDPSGDTGGDPGVSPVSPQPSEEPSLFSEERAPAPELKISGKKVDPDVWGKTAGALAAFNELTDSALGALTGAGAPSENAKRIYSRLVDWPELTAAQIRDVIERTLASKWWGDGPPSIGVIFGPKVWEDNMERKLTKKQSQKAGRSERAERGRAAIQRLMNERKEGE